MYALKWAIALAFALPASVFAYPEMIRHGYVNCNTCHISPNGAGVLTDYGRDLSRELMATWKSTDENSKEHHSLYGVLDENPLQKWLKIGGDARTLYLFRNDEFVKEGRTLLMQAGLEPAVTIGKVTAVGSIDYEHNDADDEFFSRKHYLMVGITDEWMIRAGKFIPAYGINTADHISLTRTGIRQGPRFESYNVEASYQTDRYSVFVTGILGRPESLGTPSESGGALQGSYAFSEKYKVGLNVLRGSDSVRSRWLYGPFAIIGFTEQLASLSEVDFQSTHRKSNGLDQTGVFLTERLSYEFLSGLWGFGVFEYGKSDFNNDRAQTQIYGVGVQFFPRTHFELNLSWERIKMDSFSNEFFDYAWFVAHFYL